MLAIIAAIAKNNALGKDNQLPWHLPNDLKRFRNITEGHTVIMGRKTFQSLPRILPMRKHIILTRNPLFKVEQDEVVVVHSLEEMLNTIDMQKQNFIIGGAQIYSQLLPIAEKLYLTLIDVEVEADAFFPEITSNQWKVVKQEQGITDVKNPLPHRFLTYERIQ